MPVAWNLPLVANRYNEQDRSQFARSPVWMAAQTASKLEYWSRWKGLFGTKKWTPHMGTLMQGVMAEPSPVQSQEFYPNPMTGQPLKTVVSHFERVNNAVLKRHYFESLQFNWLPSWADFRTNQLSFANKDLTRQVGIAYDLFIRSFLLQMSPYVWVVGNQDATQGTSGAPNYIACPVGDPTYAVQAKNATWRSNLATLVGKGGFPDFREFCAMRDWAKEGIGMPGWEKGPGKPKDNEVCRGKYIVMGESQLYSALSFDPHVLNFKDDRMNLLNEEFSGQISGNIVYREERYPWRMAADGTFPVPELELDVSGMTGPGSVGAGPQREVIPNPAYVNAPYGWGVFLGDQPYESIDIGPPPAEFASGKVDMRRFSELRWNGEVRLTDNLLINFGIDPTSGQQVLDTNKYGERLQLICDASFGCIGRVIRNAMPFLYRRRVLPSTVIDPIFA